MSRTAWASSLRTVMTPISQSPPEDCSDSWVRGPTMAPQPIAELEISTEPPALMCTPSFRVHVTIPTLPTCIASGGGATASACLIADRAVCDSDCPAGSNDHAIVEDSVGSLLEL